MRVTAGYGDPVTWGPCMGHPNDPRFDAEAEEAAFMAFAERQCVEDDMAMFEACYFDDCSLIPDEYIAQRVSGMDGADVVFFLFPQVSSPLKDQFVDWMDAVKNKQTKYAANKLRDILFVNGQEKLVQITETSYRPVVYKMLEELFYGDLDAANQAASRLFSDVAKEAATGALMNDAQELYDRIKDKWSHGGREDFMEGCLDE